MLLSSRRVCHVPSTVLCLLTVPSPSFWAVRSFASSLGKVLSSFVPPEPSLKQNVGFHKTWEEWEELSGLDSATLWGWVGGWVGGCGEKGGGEEGEGRGGGQRLEQYRKSTKRANSGSHLHHTPSKRQSCLPLTKRFRKGRSPPPLRPHSSPRTATCIPFPFLRTRCLTTMLGSHELLC